jgi:phosphoglycolate phosphatase-like HAD superfamily hydrolase
VDLLTGSTSLEVLVVEAIEASYRFMMAVFSYSALMLSFLVLAASSSGSTHFLAAAFSSSTLITFDVDGTLVAGSAGSSSESSAHARSYAHAVGKLFGDGSPTTPVAQALPPQDYHGSTDGLILLRLAKAELGIDNVSQDQLDQLMDIMMEYIAALPDEEVAKGIAPLPGVLDRLSALAALPKSQVSCGLVTGNVEGIARRKMRAVGVLQTQALAPPSAEQVAQNHKWKGAENIGFLGGFGSDFCSLNIQDPARNYLDRSEQIEIAAKRCQSNLAAATDDNDNSNENCRLMRVVHVGDAPADVLAAKAYADRLEKEDSDICVGMVAVATGSYSAEELTTAAGDARPGRWEPVILEKGMADEYFFDACGI